MQVRCDEGIASHIGPESCAVHREVHGEALTGECIGQPLSRDSLLILGADAVDIAEGNTSKRATASTWMTRRGRRPWHVRTLLGREPGGPTADPRPCADLVRIGKARSRGR